MLSQEQNDDEAGAPLRGPADDGERRGDEVSLPAARGDPGIGAAVLDAETWAEVLAPETIRLRACVLEAGAGSLKAHEVLDHSSVRTLKTRYAMAREVYRKGGGGAISGDTLAILGGAVASRLDLGCSPEGIVVLGTAPLRDASNGDALRARVASLHPDVEVRILPGLEEARLVLEGLERLRPQEAYPMILDVGRGSVQLAAARRARPILATYPLGTDRLLEELRDGEVDDIRFSKLEEHVGAAIADESFLRPGSGKLYVTGGAARAAARVLGERLFPTAALRSLEERTRREGPPSRLKPRSARTFLPGVHLLRVFAERVGARLVEVVDVTPGRVLAGRRALASRPGLLPGKPSGGGLKRGPRRGFPMV